MKFLLILTLLVLLPTAYVGMKEFDAYRNNPSAGYQPMTVYNAWIIYDRAGYEVYKTSFNTRVDEWNRDVRPLLDWPVLPMTLTFAGGYFIALMIMFLLGIGPFKRWTKEQPWGNLDQYKRQKRPASGRKMRQDTYNP